MEKKLQALALLVMLAAATSVTMFAGCNSCFGDVMMVDEDDDSCEDGSCDEDIVIDDME